MMMLLCSSMLSSLKMHVVEMEVSRARNSRHVHLCSEAFNIRHLQHWKGCTFTGKQSIAWSDLEATTYMYTSGVLKC